MYYCESHKSQWKMAAMERGVATEGRCSTFISLLRFVSLLDKRLGGPGNRCVAFVTARTFLIPHDKMLNRNLPQGLP